jgi:hypothetical protein
LVDHPVGICLGDVLAGTQQSNQSVSLTSSPPLKGGDSLPVEQS